MSRINKTSWLQAHPYLVFFILIMMLWISFVQVVRSGFCLSDMRIHSKEEVLSKVAGNRINDNQYCCSIHDGLGTGQWEGVEKWINILFYPEYIGYVKSYFQKDPLKLSTDTLHPYYKEIQMTNQCGNRGDRYGISITTESYQAALARNKRNIEKQGE